MSKLKILKNEKNQDEDTRVKGKREDKLLSRERHESGETQSLWQNTPAQSEIPTPLVFMPEDRVLRTIVRMGKCTCYVWILDAALLKENDSCHLFR